MKHISTAGQKRLFSQLIQSQAVQAATMVLAPGQASSEDSTNEHPNSEQWLFVVSGSGNAVVAKRRVTLTPGSLLLIERHESHLITNSGTVPLVTINFYAPPAYSAGGNVKQQAK